MRTALALLLLAAPAWASPPAAEAKKPAAKVEPKAEMKPAPRKAEAPKPGAIERHVESKKADAAPSTLTLAPTPKKKPSRRVMLADWAP